MLVKSKKQVVVDDCFEVFVEYKYLLKFMTAMDRKVEIEKFSMCMTEDDISALFIRASMKPRHRNTVEKRLYRRGFILEPIVNDEYGRCRLVEHEG